MRVDLFDFDLPSERIAHYPAEPRDSARLLQVQGNRYADCRVSDLPSLLCPSDLLVFNDTKVLPARLFAKRGTVDVEVTLNKQEKGSPDRWQVFARPGKRLRLGDRLVFAPDFHADLLAKADGGIVIVQFSCPENDLYAALARYGTMPLPPYIRRPVEAADRQRYQTLFARRPGAIAAPTAGLHFTADLLARLAQAGLQQEFVTLHVGAGTFLPVKVQDTADHIMHSEWGQVSEETACAIRAAKQADRRIVAIGTTALRILESAAQAQEMAAFAGETRLFITPGYRWRVVDALFTNFHLPRSTLFMLASAFSGVETMRAAYAHAIASAYRFFSYGDACFLERQRS